MSANPLQKFKPKLLLRSGHLQTFFSTKRKVKNPIKYESERIKTSDNDFLDLNWSANGNSKIAILCHGLEGHSRSPYMQSMTSELNKNNWDVLSWTYRSCGKEMNNTHKMYNAGETEDLDAVIQHVLQTNRYSEIILVGFSLGANLVLVYSGENNNLKENLIKACIAISAPLDLACSSRKLSKGLSVMYQNRFLFCLKEKIKQKSKQFPDNFDIKNIDQVKNFTEFDTNYTAPLYGFKNAEEYYHQRSSIRALKNISIPTLIINAQDDPFLGPDCYPDELIKQNPKITFEKPKHGGHTAFLKDFDFQNSSWAEDRTIEFINSTTTTNN